MNADRCADGMKRRSVTAHSDEQCSKKVKQDDDKTAKSTSSSLSCTSISTKEEADAKLADLRHGDPVLRLKLHTPSPSQPCPAPDINLSNLDPGQKSLLETMLHPLQPSSFLGHCFRKKAVHIQSNNAQRAQDIADNYLFGLDARQIFHETSSDSIFLWIPPDAEKEKDGNGNGKSTNKALQSIDIPDPDTAHILHTRSNYASYCRAPPELEQPLVGHMLADTGLGLGQYDPTGTKMTTLGRGEVETFVGTKGHVTGWHTDFQENFTIQLSGCKKWTLKQGTVTHPIRGTTPHYQSMPDVIENQLKAARLSNPNFQFGEQNLETNAYGDEVEIIMNAGDVLYFPAGMWHKVETLEYGVSINISLMGSTYASLVCRSLEHLLLKKDHWREVVCRYGSSLSGGVTTNSDLDSGKLVLQKLDLFLEELPHIVREFRNNNGAQGILPPVLTQKPSYEMITEDGSDGEVQQECDDEGYENATCTVDESIGDDGEVGMRSPDNDGEDSVTKADIHDGQDEMEEGIVDVEDFECPSDVDLGMSSDGNGNYVKNPLASLMRMKDVQSYFSTKKHSLCTNTSEANVGDDNLFVLNVNFAGNEMHESSVRVKLHDSSGQLETFCRLEEESLVADETSWREHVPKPHTALVYYGYLVRKSP